MNICFVLSSVQEMGGAVRATITVANRMTKDHRVFLAGIHDSEGDEPFFSSDAVVRQLSVDKAASRIRQRMKLVAEGLKRLKDEEGIDVFISVGTLAGAICSYAAVQMRQTPFIFVDHGAIANQWDSRDATLFRMLAYLSHSKTVVLTQASKDDYRRLLKAKGRKLAVVPNWIDQALLEEEASPDIESRKVVWAGRLDKEKGVDHLLDIAEKVFSDSRSDGWQWDVYGDAVLNSSIDFSRQIEERGLAGKLVHKGVAADIYALYPNYSIATLTSYREGLPLFLLEAKAAGLPAVSFDVVTGPSEIIQDGMDGFLVPPYDIDAYSERVLSLMSDPDKRAAFSAAAQGDAERFSEARIYEMWQSLLGSLVPWVAG